MRFVKPEAFLARLGQEPPEEIAAFRRETDRRIAALETRPEPPSEAEIAAIVERKLRLDELYAAWLEEG